MKFILFLIVVVIIYFVATRFKDFFNTKTPPTTIQARPILTPPTINKPLVPTRLAKNKPEISLSRIDLSDDDNTIDNLSNDKTFDDKTLQFLNKIKSEYLDTQYNFNVSILPVTSRSPNKNTSRIDAKYLRHIKQNINNWTEAFDRRQVFIVKDIKPIFIKETDNEFVVQTNTAFLYQKQLIYLDLTFYGQIERTDDFLNGGSDIYIIQLINAKPLSKTDYSTKINDYNPFPSLDENMKYVDKVNKMHANEMI